jgi:hypothetical protein
VFGSGSQKPFTGFSVNLQRYSKSPENKLSPNIPNIVIMKIRKITTFPKSGKDSIKD